MVDELAAAEARCVAHWNETAVRFDRMIAPMERRILGQTRDWMAARAGGRVLELAIGTGLNLPHYRSGTDLTGIEWSPAMLAIAHRRAAGLGVPVDLVLGDAAHLPFADASFDSVTCTLSMCCIPDDDGALAEAARVLRPGGRLVLVDHVVSTVAPLRWAQRAVEHFTIPQAGEHFTRRPIEKLPAHGFKVAESVRRTFGAIEMVDAVRA